MNKDLALQEILEGYAMETPGGNDPSVLRRWIEVHPEHADALMAFAADRALVESGTDDLTEEETAAARRRGHAALESFFSKEKSAAITSLTGMAEERGLNKQAFAQAVGMTISLIVLFEKRRVKAASVPRKVLERVASTVDTTAEAVRAYLERPQIAPSASYKAEERPEEQPQQDFAEAVRGDTGLTEEQKAELIG